MNILLAIILGGFFGFALTYVGATQFKNILKMLRLENLSLAKIILFAIGFSSSLLSISALIGIFDIYHLSIKTMNLGVVIGGLLGAFVFSLYYGYLKGLGLFETLNLGKLTLFNISDKYPSVFNIGFEGLLFVGFLFMIAAYLLPNSILKS